jgi:hypothetical protein
MNTIATVDDLRRFLGLTPGDTTDDVRLRAALRAATAAVERECGRRFTPRSAARIHATNRLLRADELPLDDDLLALYALADSAGPIALELVELLPTRGPAHTLRLRQGRAFAVGGAIVTGLWGWHDDPPAAWRSSSDEVQDNPLTMTASIIQVIDADGSDAAFEAPRFQEGALLRIDEEYLRVVRVDAAANVLHVRRGQAGTQPNAHARGTPIDVYQPPAEARDLVLRWAAWLLRQSGPLPAELRAALAPLRRLSA